MDIVQDILNNSVLEKHVFVFSTLKSKVMPNEPIIYVCPIPTHHKTEYTKSGGVEILLLNSDNKILPVTFSGIYFTIELCQ